MPIKLIGKNKLKVIFEVQYTTRKENKIKGTQSMIEISHLSKRYGTNLALDDVSFTVNEGEVLGLLGPNGAGKSTTMNILTGYLSATSGNVKVGGIDVLESPNETKAMIGYLPELPPLYLDMTVKAYLNFMYELKKVKLPRKEHIEEICQLVKIEDVYGRMIKNLSKGYKQRVGLAQALLGNPPVLVLDEPTIGLDPRQIIDIRNLIVELGKKHTVIFSSHILSEVQAVCERVVVFNRGKLIADDTPENLSRAMRIDNKLTVRVKGPKNGILSVLEGLKGMAEVLYIGSFEEGTHDFTLETDPGADVREELFNKFADRKWPILGLKGIELTLEDVFLSLIGNVDKAGIEATNGKKESSEEAMEKGGRE